MSEKLGYTFYPKDFISDPDVMMMSSSERGIYRDLIDLAYLNENKIKYNLTQLSKYCNASEEEIQKILDLKGKKEGVFWSIPSCNKRIFKTLVNRGNGNKGGRPKKPKENPTNNPTNNPNETQHERQRERERENKKEIEIKTEEELSDLFQEFFNSPTSDAMIKNNCQLHHLEEKAIRKRMKDYWLQKSFTFEANKSIHDIRSHFTNWLKLDLKANPPFRINQ
jgi:hypothetical protein